METTTRLLLPDVVEALNLAPTELLSLTEELHPADLADLAQALDPELRKKLLSVLPPHLCADMLEHCDESVRTELFEPLVQHDIAVATAITDVMAADDRADMLAEIDSTLRAKLLENLGEEESKDIRRLLAYEENSAGALMTTDFVALPADTTAEGAIAQIRAIAQEMETIYQAYAVDPNSTLLGVISLRDLVTSPQNSTLVELMNPSIISCRVDTDQEEVVRLIAKYDLLALPVVDFHHRIVGIVTVDDAIDVVEEEATEDAQKLGAVEPLDAPYISTPILHLIRARLPWLIMLFFGVLATPIVLKHYTQVHSAGIAVLLTWFVPLIASSGGNSGTQSASLVIRALALGTIEPSDSRNVLLRELLVGLCLGIVLACVGAVAALALDTPQTGGLGFTIGCALVAVVTVGALLGSGVPLLLQRLGLDPAVASTPLIASVVDITGLVIYFEIARLFMS